MPDDFVLNVRQVAQYQQLPAAPANSVLLLQRNGIGGPYGSIAPQDLIASAIPNAGSLQVNGDLVLSGTLTAPQVGAQAITAREVNANLATFQSLDAIQAAVNGQPVATRPELAQLAATTVRSINGKTGPITLTVDDVMGAAPSHAPFFGGTPRTNSPWPNAADGEIVTAEWVRNFALNGNMVASFNGRRGAVRLRLTDLLESGGAPINSPEFMGKPLAPTPPGYDLSDRIATTRFVKWAIDEGGWRGPPGPPGPQGPVGTGFNFRGTLPDATQLPPSGNEVSDLYITQDTNTGYVWTGSTWQPIGMITPSARVYVSDTAPLTATDGDLWFSSLTGDLWVYYQGPSGGQWVIANAGVEGPQGPPGDQGLPGPNVSIGVAPPVGATSGMLWYNPSTGNTQVFDGASWLPVSEPSATVTVGTTPPAGPAEGDLWFDTSSTGELMVFMQGFWVAAANGQVGPQGPTGPPGTPGIQGIQGVQGPPGVGIQFLGDQANYAAIAALPSPSQGDAWVALDTGDLWVYNGSSWDGPYPFGGGIPDAPTPGIYGRENGAWVALLDDGVF